MALLGLDGVWHVPRDRTEDATTSICGLRFIGEFDGRDDAELPLGEWCPDCTEQDVDSAAAGCAGAAGRGGRDRS